MEFNILKRWNFLLDEFPPDKKDTYFREEYLKLYETKDEKAICFYYRDGSNILLFPYLLRSFWIEDICFHDFETPYGYGGPIVNTNDKEFIINALASFYSYGVKNHYVAGFVRFHPLLDNSIYFDTIGIIIKDRNTVAIDLRKDTDTIWMNEIHTKNRNIIRKAIKNNLIFIPDYQYMYLPDFIRLYNKTMDKLDADAFYYFPESYYYSFHKQIKNSFLGIVLNANKVISSAIFFYSEDYGHYHLSGNDSNYLSLYPNNFMLWKAALELKKKGVKKFHLGGGTNAENHNTLLEFKCKFSQSLYTFQIGKIIFNHRIYEELCMDWIKNNPESKEKYGNYLLKYKY